MWPPANGLHGDIADALVDADSGRPKLRFATIGVEEALSTARMGTSEVAATDGETSPPKLLCQSLPSVCVASNEASETVRDALGDRPSEAKSITPLTVLPPAAEAEVARPRGGRELPVGPRPPVEQRRAAAAEAASQETRTRAENPQEPKARPRSQVEAAATQPPGAADQPTEGPLHHSTRANPRPTRPSRSWRVSSAIASRPQPQSSPDAHSHSTLPPAAALPQEARTSASQGFTWRAAHELSRRPLLAERSSCRVRSASAALREISASCSANVRPSGQGPWIQVLLDFRAASWP
mmetsp:Transcript_129993/g.337093  ORF Transcript_129993/g.337093 Transcript_129993/m.337093 type:complete len:296 (-) Transcript_129993:29-916(-)